MSLSMCRCNCPYHCHCHLNLIAYFLYPKEIKLGKFQEAVDDCDHVLSIEPKNVKGTTFNDSQ